MEGEKGPVCVTGGTGFIGSWLIKRLLDYGFSVRTTIRSNPASSKNCTMGIENVIAEHKKDLDFLTSLPRASEKLKIFNADLSNPETFSAAIKGCIGVFHVATPVDFEDKEPEETVTKRSIDGAVGILKTCLDSKTVKKVIYTSSASAVVINGKDFDEMDESFWSDVDYIKAQNSFAGSYMISKTLTERAVLEFSEKNGLEVATLIPSFVVGPFICPKLPGSVQTALDMVFSKKNNESVFLSQMDMVHVDDVARAHIFLFEQPEAKGRYNCSANTITAQSASKLLSAKYPELEIPIKNSQEENKGFFPSLSSKKLIDSGFKFKYGVEEMYDDAIKCCKEKGYL